MVYDHDQRLRIVAAVTEQPPDRASHWSHAQSWPRNWRTWESRPPKIGRILADLDIKPHRVRSWITRPDDPGFWERTADICGLYLVPPTGALVLSVDEKTGMPARSRTQATTRTARGRPARQEHEYVRHVTAVLLDNGSSHIARDTSWWFMDHPRFHPHSTFSHASWLNQVEPLFSILARRLLKRGEFGSVEDGGQGDGVHRRLQPHRHAVSLDLRRPTPQCQQQLTRSCTSAQKRERSSYK